MIFPLSRSTQITESSLPSGVPVVIQICFPQMTGEDQPLPWIAVFHATFLVSLHSRGRPLASAWPSPLGPRNSAQLSLGAEVQPRTARVTVIAEMNSRDLIVFPRFKGPPLYTTAGERIGNTE